MFKLIITGLIVYFIYRFFIKTPALRPSEQDQPTPIHKESGNGPEPEDEGEYIDYEEVD